MLGQSFVALVLMHLASAYPVAGSVYQWARFLVGVCCVLDVLDVCGVWCVFGVRCLVCVWCAVFGACCVVVVCLVCAVCRE